MKFVAICYGNDWKRVQISISEWRFRAPLHRALEIRSWQDAPELPLPLGSGSNFLLQENTDFLPQNGLCPPGGPWSNYLTSPSFSFLICYLGGVNENGGSKHCIFHHDVLDGERSRHTGYNLGLGKLAVAVFPLPIKKPSQNISDVLTGITFYVFQFIALRCRAWTFMYLCSNFIKEAQNFIIIKHDEKYITYDKYQQWITAVSATILIVGGMLI